jgi:hypothetical protein
MGGGFATLLKQQHGASFEMAYGDGGVRVETR